MKTIVALILLTASVASAWKGSTEIKKFESYSEALISLKTDLAIQSASLNRHPLPKVSTQSTIDYIEDRIREVSPMRGMLLIAGSFVLLILVQRLDKIGENKALDSIGTSCTGPDRVS